jgi:hypothetical protein
MGVTAHGVCTLHGNDRTLKIESFHYYVPVDATHPTYDSFSFEFVLGSMYNGPVLNPDHTNTLTTNELLNVVSVTTFSVPGACFDAFLHHAQSSIGVFTVFQATKAPEHDLNAKGLNDVVALGKHNHMEAMAIRYIAVIPAGHEVKIKSPSIGVANWECMQCRFCLIQGNPYILMTESAIYK